MHAGSTARIRDCTLAQYSPAAAATADSLNGNAHVAGQDRHVSLRSAPCLTSSQHKQTRHTCGATHSALPLLPLLMLLQLPLLQQTISLSVQRGALRWLFVRTNTSAIYLLTALQLCWCPANATHTLTATLQEHRRFLSQL
jgi:hypothetical protein